MRPPGQAECYPDRARVIGDSPAEELPHLCSGPSMQRHHRTSRTVARLLPGQRPGRYLRSSPLAMGCHVEGVGRSESESSDSGESRLDPHHGAVLRVPRHSSDLRAPPRPSPQRSDNSTVPSSRRIGTTTDADFPFLRRPGCSPSCPYSDGNRLQVGVVIGPARASKRGQVSHGPRPKRWNRRRLGPFFKLTHYMWKWTGRLRHTGGCGTAESRPYGPSTPVPPASPDHCQLYQAGGNRSLRESERSMNRGESD